VEVIRKTLFASETLQIGLFHARPASDACGDIERQTSNAMVLPVSGVFSKHDTPGRCVIGTPSHAVFFAADASYRIGFPGAIGDRALVLRFGEALLADNLDRRGGSDPLTSHGLLPPHAMMLRNLLCARLQRTDADELGSEALGLDLLSMSLSCVRASGSPLRRSTLARRRAMERVKEAVALAPADRWSVAKLAEVANLSPFHLCHVSAKWSVPRSMTMYCTSVSRTPLMPFLTAAMTSRLSRSMQDLRATATSRRVSDASSAAPRRPCGTSDQPSMPPNCARS
jgi:hypothetical protein